MSLTKQNVEDKVMIDWNSPDYGAGAMYDRIDYVSDRVSDLMGEVEADCRDNERIAEKLEEAVYGDELGSFAIFAASSSAACHALDKAIKGHALTEYDSTALKVLYKHMSNLELKREELTVAEVDA